MGRTGLNPVLGGSDPVTTGPLAPSGYLKSVGLGKPAGGRRERAGRPPTEGKRAGGSPAREPPARTLSGAVDQTRSSEIRAFSSRKMMMPMLKAIMKVEIALISGPTLRLTIDQM